MKNEEPETIGDNRQPDGTFGPGNVANPNGRPKGTFSLVGMLKAELQKCPEGQDQITYANMLIRKILDEAIENGDAQQIKNILNYVEGMPVQRVEGDLDIKTSLVEFIDGKSKD